MPIKIYNMVSNRMAVADINVLGKSTGRDQRGSMPVGYDRAMTKPIVMMIIWTIIYKSIATTDCTDYTDFRDCNLRNLWFTSYIVLLHRGYSP